MAAVSLVLALSTWHAMRFFVTLEAACIVAWFLRTGQNPLAARRAWILPAILAAGALLVPVLRAKWFVLSFCMQAVAAHGARRVGRAARGARTERTPGSRVGGAARVRRHRLPGSREDSARRTTTAT